MNPGAPTTDEQAERAKVFDDRAAKRAAAGDYSSAIELYAMGVWLEPDNVERHRALRELSLRRKAEGGADLGWRQRVRRRLRRGGSAQDRLVYEAVRLAYNPGSIERIGAVRRAARDGGFERTAEWAAELLRVSGEGR